MAPPARKNMNFFLMLTRARTEPIKERKSIFFEKYTTNTIFLFHFSCRVPSFLGYYPLIMANIRLYD